MDCLSIPRSVQEKVREHSKDEEQQREECIYYWMNVSPYSMIGWGVLGGELHFYGQEAALRAANEYIQRAPGTCGCGMCMYRNADQSYITQQIHACSDSLHYDHQKSIYVQYILMSTRGLHGAYGG